MVKCFLPLILVSADWLRASPGLSDGRASSRTEETSVPADVMQFDEDGSSKSAIERTASRRTGERYDARSHGGNSYWEAYAGQAPSSYGKPQWDRTGAEAADAN